MKEKGVTLIELVIVIVLVGVLASGFGWYFTNVIDTWNFISFRSEVINQARLGFMQMVRQIRQIKRPTPTQPTIEQADQDSLQFIRLDDSGNDMRIQYHASGTELFYDLDSDFNGTFETSEILVNGIYNFAFRYYNQEGDELTFPVDVESIYEIGEEFEVREREQGYDFQTRVFPRNLRG